MTKPTKETTFVELIRFCGLDINNVGRQLRKPIALNRDDIKQIEDWGPIEEDTFACQITMRGTGDKNTYLVLGTYEDVMKKVRG